MRSSGTRVTQYYIYFRPLPVRIYNLEQLYEVRIFWSDFVFLLQTRLRDT